MNKFEFEARLKTALVENGVGSVDVRLSETSYSQLFGIYVDNEYFCMNFQELESEKEIKSNIKKMVNFAKKRHEQWKIEAIVKNYMLDENGQIKEEFATRVPFIFQMLMFYAPLIVLYFLGFFC